MGSARAEGGARALGHLLQDLLTNDPRYRDRWSRRVRRQSGDSVNEAAVARVIVDHLARTGQAAVLDEEVAARQNKDMVRRALRGTTLTGGTLKLFIDAFSMDDSDTAALWSLFGGGGVDERVRGGIESPTRSAFQPPRHRTVSLAEFHSIGADRKPQRHRVLQVIRATEDGLRRYPYRFDTSTISVEVLTGGTATPMYQVDGDLYAVDLVLDRPLNRGEVRMLEFLSTFAYERVPEPCYRRAALARMDAVAIQITFTPPALPRSIWWSVWDGYKPDSRVVAQEEVLLGPDHTVTRFVEGIDRSAVGFSWAW